MSREVEREVPRDSIGGGMLSIVMLRDSRVKSPVLH